MTETTDAPDKTGTTGTEEWSPPQQKLSPHAISLWRVSAILYNVIGFVVLAALLILDSVYDWRPWIGWILWGVTVISAGYAVWDIFLQPVWLYRYWFYGVNAEFVQLKHGALNKVHQVIPMAKVQSVSTNQGPLMRKYGLYSVSIGTMGSSHHIPALPEDVAFALRNQIADYARINEVDE
ncbi:membrane protein YdbS with pleckstrin-like domain [Paenibacillus sp. 4624]|jgi:membrane protein YdbS with pleckstrin-like domain|uniref:PH domain-containing protein n=1 Tax=Paenibacillus amylolyticus TaxID=1451 RepID=A0A5M9WUM1_PAEAM|nr:PH domain-containing protein [Paenibacillus amylolyticus]KAA8785377.1 PH domain-containing protein [Paenibacillus amylolyticus]